MGNRLEQVIRLLDDLERREAALLCWGVTSGGFSQRELRDRVSAVCGNTEEVEDLLEDLEFAGLLVQSRESGKGLWRTRSAETVRLLAHLRQLFPKHRKRIEGWRTAASLVADYRYAIRARTYPRRHLKPENVLDSLPDDVLTPTRRRILKVLLDSEDRRLVLSDFQLQSTHRIFAALASKRNRGVVVGAGTGSGKTLAFYLPALSWIGELCDDLRWTKALAIYPRKELLKDQFAQAYEEARRLDGLLKRPLSIGAYYGDTPLTEGVVRSKWSRGRSGYICPFMACPQCREPLEWTEADISASRSRLTCSGCGKTVNNTEVALTRQQMSQTPPDVLFTTTEMLNRQLANMWDRHVFGVRAKRPPILMLLDEIHTYDGVSGAQTAMLIRRWKHAVGTPVCFVGLSATLRDAGHFFGQLTGLEDDHVTYVRPEPSEFEHEGGEYLLALRSDPGSGASVLSTTIQTAMLLSRCLDPIGRGDDSGPSGGIYGSKAFVFTDALDVLNRLFFDLRDAEGLDSWGRSVKDSLATLRDPTRITSPSDVPAGQSWDLPATIGHPLSPGSRLRIGRTSSQDVGVDREAEVIVATASLEVGFNDPSVGAVIQHKAPRGAAAFYQRKGRAGRTRRMRPWTVIVLSDYGRDREAYQTYDLLFDPELPARNLPIRNTYVLRVHAIQAFFDWVALRLGNGVKSSVRHDLSQPTFDIGQRKRQRMIADLVESVLSDRAMRRDFAKYVAGALGISARGVDEVLWNPPRPVLTSALPTLLRRIRSNWSTADPNGIQEGTDRHTRFTPLPDYVPPSLFAPLDLPEAVVEVPAQTQHDAATEELMPVAQALREFAPGRVSRRFGINNTYSRHWLTHGEISDESEQTISVDVAYVFEPLGDFAYESGEKLRKVAVVRPERIRTTKVASKYLDSSHGRLHWHTQVATGQSQGTPVDIPGSHRFASLYRDTTAFLHANRSPATVRRFARYADADIRLRDGGAVSSRFFFVRDNGDRVAVGTFFPVDAIRIRIPVPDLNWVLDSSVTPAVHRAFRTEFFHWRFIGDPILRSHANEFQLQWIHDALLSTLLDVAESNRIGLEEAFTRLGRPFGPRFFDTLEALLEHPSTTSEGDWGNDSTEDKAPTRVYQRLVDLFANNEFERRVRSIAPLLWAPPTEEWCERARSRFLSTVANGTLSTFLSLCPEFPEDELTVDLDFQVSLNSRRHDGEIWISESTVGGAGFLERVLAKIAEDPRRFFRLFETALRPTDLEVIDEQIRILLEARRGRRLANRLDDYRKATDHDSHRIRLSALLRELQRVGVSTSHPVVSALLNRVVRPGSTPDADTMLHDLLAGWDAVEKRHGIEFGVRAYAFHASRNTQVDIATAARVPTGNDDARWRFNVIRGLLWERGWTTNGRGLTSYNAYHDQPPPAPALVHGSAPEIAPPVDLDEGDWAALCHKALANHGQAVLCASMDRADDLANALADLSTRPIDVGFLHLYAAVVAIRESQGCREVHLELREVVR